MKNFFKSKTVWFNILMGLNDIAQIIPIPHATEVQVIGNLILRRITKGPVRFLPQE